jgi:RNA polymerase sigma-70 factor, ECF subfamily
MNIATAQVEPGDRARQPSTRDDLEERLVDLRPELLRMAGRWTHHQAAAEDLVQDVLIRVLQARPRYRPGSNLKAWATCVMRNLFIDTYRRKRELPLDFEVEGPCQADREIGAIDRVTMEDVEAVLATLHEGDRKIFDLWHSRGLSYRQIAEALGLNPVTVGTRLYRVRARLRARLESLYE